jgi:hypothetical protein
MALSMARERSSGGSCIIFVFLVLACKHGTQVNESFIKYRYDRLLFTFLFVFDSQRLSNYNGSGKRTKTTKGKLHRE